jgi:hypothetical protein
MQGGGESMSENEKEKGRLHPLNPTGDPDVQEGVVKYFAERREQEREKKEQMRRLIQEFEPPKNDEIHTSGGTVKGNDKKRARSPLKTTRVSIMFIIISSLAVS